MDPTCAKCGRNHPGTGHDSSTITFMCGQEVHFMKQCSKKKQGNKAQFSAVAATELHLEKLLQEQVEERTIYMISLAAKSKIILKML